MANPDGICGIGGDRKFMDMLYLYYKMKKDILKENCKSENGHAVKKCELYLYYLSAVEYCLSKITELENRNTQHSYLNWIRWNIDVILNELLYFEEISTDENTLQCINSAKQAIQRVFFTHFQLTAQEKAISNQYVHNLEAVSRSTRLRNNVLINTGKMYINYVNLLQKRCYIDKIDRDDVSFAQMNAEADLLIKKLEDGNIDPILCKQISEIKSMYDDFRLMDAVLRKKDDENIKTGLELAHGRATESFIESTIRKTAEAISQLKLKLIKLRNRAWEASVILFNPTRTIDSLIQFFKHPIDSIKGALSWAKENPWKFAGIVLGGIAIGAVVGVGIHFAAPKILAASFSSILPNVVTSVLTGLSTSLVGSIAVGGVGTGMISMGLLGGNVMLLKEDERGIEIEIQRKEKEKLEKLAENKHLGASVAGNCLLEEEKREYMKKQCSAHEYFQKYQQAEQRLSDSRANQMENMTIEQLDESDETLRLHKDELEVELERTRNDLVELQTTAARKQADIIKVKEGYEALRRLMQDVSDANLKHSS